MALWIKSRSCFKLILLIVFTSYHSFNFVVISCRYTVKQLKIKNGFKSFKPKLWKKAIPNYLFSGRLTKISNQRKLCKRCCGIGPLLVSPGETLQSKSLTGDGGFHYHCTVKLTGNKKWIAVKTRLTGNHYIGVNLSDKHNFYISKTG